MVPATGTAPDQVRVRVEEIEGLDVIAWLVGKEDGVPFIECLLEGRSPTELNDCVSRLSALDLIADLHADPS